MANLDITGATFGMDTNGAEKYIEDIRNEVLRQAAADIEDAIDDLDGKLSAVMQGNARDTLIKTMKQDAEALYDNLIELTNDLEAGIEQIRDTLNDYDKSVEVANALGRRG